MKSLLVQNLTDARFCYFYGMFLMISYNLCIYIFFWKTWKCWFHIGFLMIYDANITSRSRGKPSTAPPPRRHGGQEERNSTGTLRCRFREKYRCSFCNRLLKQIPRHAWFCYFYGTFSMFSYISRIFKFYRKTWKCWVYNCF